MNFEIQSENDVQIVVPLVRRLDASVEQTFKQQVLEVIEKSNKKNTHDLFKLTRMDRIFSIKANRQAALQVLMG
ncbi:hypothetical protein CWR52_22885 [Enterobacter sp. SGAir0187]|uniref:STAS domain-containing protein n=1 Tax=Enterobacter sp. SGAir0187 TaxID=2836161 RepID=UPI000CEB7F0E|nr:STAS domain-containing protein [Enterobacter sp. SGAir0187]AVH19843.1 hypothetical protein CWR52_22885 [Enterobacter sp. SGAir0187]